MTDSLAEKRPFWCCELEECAFPIGEGAALLSYETHGVEAVEDVFSRAHNASIRGIREGPSEFKLGFGRGS